MRKIFFLLLSAVLLMQSCSSRKSNRGEQIIEWINEEQKDSLRANLHKDFIFETRDAPLDNFKDAGFFLGEFMENQKFLEGNYKVNKLEYEAGAEDGHPIDMYQAHTTYNNIYQKYLGVDPYKSLIKMEFYEGKLVSMSMGSGDKDQAKAFQEELRKFHTWMGEKHPDEKFNDLIKKKDKLLIERMKEYKRGN